jgi:hypothetical protein
MSRIAEADFKLWSPLHSSPSVLSHQQPVNMLVTLRTFNTILHYKRKELEEMWINQLRLSV